MRGLKRMLSCWIVYWKFESRRSDHISPFPFHWLFRQTDHSWRFCIGKMLFRCAMVSSTGILPILSTIPSSFCFSIPLSSVQMMMIGHYQLAESRRWGQAGVESTWWCAHRCNRCLDNEGVIEFTYNYWSKCLPIEMCTSGGRNSYQDILDASIPFFFPKIK